MTERPPRGRIVVFGILFWYPLAGVTYQFLHYLRGLRRLGYDVTYVEDSGRWVYDPLLNDLSPDASPNVEAVAPVLEAHGFAGRWAFRGAYPGGRCYGLSSEAVDELYRTADAFLNITGAQELREEHLSIPRRVYVESDPFASQVRAAQGEPKTTAALAAHDVHFTFGENLGAADCTVPLGSLRWLPTRQPVDLELWSSAGAGSSYRTITTWHNSGKDVVFGGERYYWTKDREFEKVLDVPERRPQSFELAATVDDETRRRLEARGWNVVGSIDVSRSVELYRAYIEGSRAELTVARDQYVRPRTGWFSDRSACYLAAGRPVITQETGFTKFLPSGRGLFSFRTSDDIVAAVDAIESDYPAHSRAAREIAAECFAAEKVVGSLMERAGL